VILPLLVPSPVPFTASGCPLASRPMSIGLPALSAPVVRSSACSMYLKVPFALRLAARYIVLVDGSMTGVLLIPMSGCVFTQVDADIHGVSMLLRDQIRSQGLSALNA
jgi:hypothetical protein